MANKDHPSEPTPESQDRWAKRAAQLEVDLDRLRELNRILLAALLAVHHEVTDGVKPYSSDSYLPNHIRDHVAEAIKRAQS